MKNVPDQLREIATMLEAKEVIDFKLNSHLGDPISFGIDEHGQTFSEFEKVLTIRIVICQKTGQPKTV